MEAWVPGNLALFNLLNASATPTPVLRALAHLFAVDALYALMLAMTVVWFTGTAAARRSLMLAVSAVAAGVVVNVLIGTVLGTPRPFAAGIGHQLLAHSADASFPSDHGTVVWSIGLCLIATGQARFGRGVMWLGLLVAWARVYLGVHYPLDFLGGFAVAFGAVVVVLRHEWRLVPYMHAIEAWHAERGKEPLW
ncbi:MAG: phosphatase PAP2 family protein [Paracoccaceae bacterium]|nr:phosphatase PAP2 family protein [Paracoccaceae bacterium]